MAVGRGVSVGSGVSVAGGSGVGSAVAGAAGAEPQAASSRQAEEGDGGFDSFHGLLRWNDVMGRFLVRVNLRSNSNNEIFEIQAL